ncbi:thioesterase family protein [Noviherbaspirillum sp.]|uniref:acyl-CoA thioesterase n=1 Tax=Noviherbaspirillum sp. TaxID=1926288 RepID=UPI002D57626F|nr:thioesterase family protein [Noviherbaspirillum sp.]HZW22094.1 thioesterase family protein [Noviherbaspirillum sp.]
MTLHPFDQAIALSTEGEDLRRGHTSAHYWNAISPFGGTTVATLLQAILTDPRRLGDPLALTVNFAGPLQKGDFMLRVHPVRTGRSTQHWQIEIRQGDDQEPAVTGSAVFAVRRDAWSDTESRMPQADAPERLDRYASPANVPFLSMYDVRYADCNPLAGGKDSATQCWISDVPPRPLDFPSIAAQCDTFIPRLFVRKGGPTAISTVTLTINFHVDSAGLQRVEGHHTFAQAKANAFNGGYYDQEGKLWSRNGQLLATTHQMVWYRDQAL